MTFNQSFILFSLIVVTLLLMHISSINRHRVTTLEKQNIEMMIMIDELYLAGSYQAEAGLILCEEIKILKETTK